MHTLAIITARGGSKRIPRKNIRDFCGKPMIAWSVGAALESGVFDTVMVSTDDEEIAEIAKRCGAAVPFLRSADTADDFATTADVMQEVLAQYEAQGERFDLVCCLYPTAPFVKAGVLRDAYERFAKSDADSLIPVVRFSYPVQRAFVEEDGLLVMAHPEYRDTRSQDLTPHFHDAGQFYFFRPESLRKYGSFLQGKILPLELPETKVQDIDTEEDWEIAEMKFRLLREAEGGASVAGPGVSATGGGASADEARPARHGAQPADEAEPARHGAQQADAPRLTLREAAMTDASLLYAWRMEPATRAASFHAEDFSYESHLAWLEQRLPRPGIWILLCDGVPAGTMRVETEGSEAQLSYSVDPAYRGRGFGAALLRLTEEKIKTTFAGSVHSLVAQVKKDNLPSRRMPEACGFTAEEKDTYIEYRKTI
ncbi:MAG: pseudaminic acid cytidylyltransferase [Lachnospiraceae bacterium]|nr:pseudaminic acid cytidylyltransferase [Lachnospiraceae bacterium]